MSSPAATGPKGDDIFAISKKGDDELKAADTSLSAAELQVLVLSDGFSSVWAWSRARRSSATTS